MSNRSIESNVSEESLPNKTVCRIPQRMRVAFYISFILLFSRLSTNLIFNLNNLVTIKKEALEVNKTLNDKTKNVTLKTLQEQIGVICLDSSYRKSYFLDIVDDIPDNIFHADYDYWGETYIFEMECANYITMGLGYFGFALLTNRTGVKHFVTVAMLLVSVSNFVLPVVIDSSKGNFTITLIAYAVYGLLESSFFVFCTCILSHWTPKREISLTCGLTFTGYFLEPVFSTALSSELFLLSKNWKNVFFAFGGLGMGVALGWHCFVQESPQSNKVKLNSDEELYLKRELFSTVQLCRKQFPIKQIMSTPSFWGMVFGSFAPIWSEIMGWIIFSEILQAMYAVSLVHDIKWTLIKVFLTFFNTALFGFLTDWLVNRQYLSLRILRQFFTVISSLGPTIFLLSASYIFCHNKVVTTQFAIGSFLQSFFGLGARLLPFDVSPNFSAFLMGFAKCLSSFCILGIKFFYLKVTPDNALWEFQNFLWWMLGLMFFTTLIFVLLTDTKLAKWNEIIEIHHRTKTGRKKSIFGPRQ